MTTTSEPLRAPTAVDDEQSGVTGVGFSGNVLTNDDLGNPPGRIISLEFAAGPQLNYATHFDINTGIYAVDALIDPYFHESTSIWYTIENVVGSSTARLDLSVIPPPTTTSTTLPNQPPRAPTAVNDVRTSWFGPVNVLYNDDLGNPPGRITSWTELEGNGTLRLDPSTGAFTIVANPVDGVYAMLSYTVENEAGTSTATLEVRLGPLP